MATILLTDGQQRKTLSAARSLGRAGHRVLVAEVTRLALARFSRHTALGLVSPDPAREPGSFLTWMIDTVALHRVDVVIPMDDASTEILSRDGDRVPAALLLPTAAQFQAGRDKAATLALAERSGVRAPRTASLARAAAGELGWPVVVKARLGSGGRGVRLASDPASLRRMADAVPGLAGTHLLMEYIKMGRKYDVGLLYDRSGGCVARFCQEELRGYPLWNGPSTLQESQSRPDLIALAERLLAPIGWRGPVEVEFMEEPQSGEPVLMEINPRFWASLELSVQCGMDFPRWVAELGLGLQPALPDGYPAGLRCRWLLPGDLLHYLSNPDRSRMEPPFFRTMDGRTRDDILDREDPLPALGLAAAVLRHLFDLRMWRMVIR